MARRRRPEDVAPDGPTLDVPARLIRCVVEDWVKPAEAVAAEVIPGVRRSFATIDDAEFWFLMRANRRRAAARMVFVEEHGLARGELESLGGGGRPSFRDATPYRAAAQRAAELGG